MDRRLPVAQQSSTAATQWGAPERDEAVRQTKNLNYNGRLSHNNRAGLQTFGCAPSSSFAARYAPTHKYASIYPIWVRCGTVWCCAARGYCVRSISFLLVCCRVAPVATARTRATQHTTRSIWVPRLRVCVENGAQTTSRGAHHPSVLQTFGWCSTEHVRTSRISWVCVSVCVCVYDGCSVSCTLKYNISRSFTEERKHFCVRQSEMGAASCRSIYVYIRMFVCG